MTNQAHAPTSHVGTLLMVVVLLVTPGCTLVQLLIPPENLKVLPPKEFAAAITKEGVLLVDVHTPEQAHIKGTDHFIPYDEVGQHLASFPARRSTPIYLYCKSGHMVNVSARTLYGMKWSVPLIWACSGV